MKPIIKEVNSRTEPFWIIVNKTHDDIYYMCPKGLDSYMFINMFSNLAIPFLNKEDAEKQLERVKNGDNRRI